jgi:3-hydroxyacyl-CoA dehydrogenase/enoyl-CoA hydratase/3-hydroxybutyryl-CoA epimerase
VLETGISGRKGGRGFYLYEDGKAKGVNPDVEAALRDSADDEPAAEPEAEERMVFAMINEAARILDAGVVDTPETVDVAMIMGTGFPPFRGGLLRYADSLGLELVAERLSHYAQSVGSRLDPAPALLERKAFYAA